MKTLIFAIFLILSLASSEFSARADNASSPACAAMSGLYLGQCTTHWSDGPYTFAEYIRVRQFPAQTSAQTPTSGGQTFLPGLGCGTVEIVQWTGGTPETTDFLSDQTFSILAATGLSETHTTSVGATVTATTARWSADRSRFLIFQTTTGKEDDGISAYTTKSTTTLSLVDSQLVLSTAETGAYAIDTDCQFNAVPDSNR